MSYPSIDSGTYFAEVLALARRGVALVPGSYITENGLCSCGDVTCRRPGAHPMVAGWLDRASTRPLLLAQWWTGSWANANLIASLTGTFDVLDLPASVADIVVRRLPEAGGLHVPVVATPSGRRQIWVKAGAAVRLPDRLSQRLPAGSRPDLRLYMRGSYVLAPPSQVGQGQMYGWNRPLKGHIDTLADADPVIDAVIEAYAKVTG